jgi:hypothetical protein
VSGESTPSTREITLEDWAACEPYLRGEMRLLSRRMTWIQFALGDWLNYGEAHFGETEIWNVLDPHNYDPGTLNNFKSVARRVHPSRRNENLTYYHHAAVAGLLPDEQAEWLNVAERDNLGSAALREQVRAEQGKTPSGEIECPNCHTRFRRGA